MNIPRALLAALAGSLLFAPFLGAAEHSTSIELLSQPYTIDRKYKSMEGPSGIQPITLTHADPPELLWITGYRVVVVGADGTSPASQEFMCHNNLDFTDVSLHNQLFRTTNPITPRLFTLSQGQFSIQFPKGFGLPVLSNEPLSLATQVLNHNVEHPNVQVRHKVTVDFVRDQDVERPMKPLFSIAPFVMVLLEGTDGYFGMSETEAAGTHASGCLPGVHASSQTSGDLHSDQFGRKFSGHWVVKPGRQVNAMPVTKWMNSLLYDTTLHYVAVHVHPYAQTLELRDVTTGTSVFTSHITSFPDRVGVATVEVYSSTKGAPIYKNHEYELVSVYDNPTGVEQDAMATFFLYLLDKDFRKPTVGVSATAPASSTATP